MKKLLLSCLLVALFSGFSVAQSYQETIVAFQEELNAEYKNPEESPLSASERKQFKGLPYFPINEKYRVMAKFEKLPPQSLFQMKTTANSIKDYDVYGVLSFTIEGKEYRLNVYQSHILRTQEKYKDYLFLPFTDLTNGKESYGGGRYMDLKIPMGDTIELDFNKAYNPFCAYAEGYACPIPPRENDLPLSIRAGVKYEPKH
ncbi:DUF1684 domain-containing protein [Algoriphagus aestuarii]|nr:DUF1684 domain-containing protein [Algoriphagus aestuarii]